MSKHESGSLSPFENNPAFAEIKAMSDADRIADQQRVKLDIGKAITRLAMHVYVMEKEGKSLDDFRKQFGGPFTDMLRLVANGNLNPALFHKFWSKLGLLRQLSYLPLADQNMIADSGYVPRLVIGPSGVSEIRQTEIGQLTNEEIQQVFADGHIRSQHEQANWLDRKRAELVRPKIQDSMTVRLGKVDLDAERAIAKLPKGGEYTLAELKEIVRLLELGR